MSQSNEAGELPRSLWAATATPRIPYTELGHDRAADVCVIGGGFTGLSTALHAAEAGARVVLLEAAEDRGPGGQYLLERKASRHLLPLPQGFAGMTK